MAAENLDSSFISTLNTQPQQMLTSGEGAPGFLQSIDDYIAVTAVGMASIGSTYRLCRFPTRAKIKSLVIDLGIVDSGGATAVFDINVAFSDSLYDGTPSVYTPSNGATAVSATGIPKTGAAGTVTSITSYSSPNKLFGTVTAANNAVKNGTNVTFAGTYASWAYAGPSLPLWDFFGFVNTQGYAQDPGGFFDILLYLSTAAATGAAAQIHAKLDYVL